MLYIIGPMFVIVVLFGLCESGERALESQRDFWMRNHRALGRMKWGWSY